MTASEPSSADLAGRWLTVLAAADFSAWPSVVAHDVRMAFPFAPAGMPSRCDGREACQTAVRTFFAGLASFAWHDLQLFPAGDPTLVFGTARSQAVLRTGRRYENDYCFMMRFHGRKLSEYREYFNPLPAIEAFGLQTYTRAPGSKR